MDPAPPSPAADAAAARRDERALLRRLRAGEEAAFEELVRAHAGRMLAVARRMLRHEQDAADAVQEAFLSAFRAIDGFEGGSRLGTWLHRITVNAALMHMRRARRRKDDVPLQELLPRFRDDGHMVDPPAGWEADAEAIARRREVGEAVRRSIDRLPESYRTVLLLRDIEELSTEETARQLDVNAGVVKTRLHRARQALRTLLDPHVSDLLP